MTTPLDPASPAAGPQPGATDTTTPMPSVPGPMTAMPGPMPGAPGPMAGMPGPMSGPPGPYGFAGPRRAAAVGRRGRQQMIIGGALFVVGLLITFLTYSRASSSPSGGSYFVAYGPMIVGVVWFARGALLLARSRRPGR
jgi:hypothetical protein